MTTKPKQAEMLQLYRMMTEAWTGEAQAIGTGRIMIPVAVCARS